MTRRHGNCFSSFIWKHAGATTISISPPEKDEHIAWIDALLDRKGSTLHLTKLPLMAEIHDGKCRGGINLEMTLKPNGLGVFFFSPVNATQKWEFNPSEIESAGRQDITFLYIWGGTDFLKIFSNSPALERSLKAGIWSAILAFVWVEDLRTWILQLERIRCYIERVFTDHTLTEDGDVCVKPSSPSRVRAPLCNKTAGWRASAGAWIFYALCICWMSRRRRELLGLNYLFQISKSRRIRLIPPATLTEEF